MRRRPSGPLARAFALLLTLAAGAGGVCAAARADLDAEREDLRAAFLAAPETERGELYARLAREWKETEVAALLGELGLAAAGRLERGGTLAALERLARDRADLDRARAAARTLIFDEQRYFYPYHPPAVPASRAAEYPRVQAEVDELVGELRDVWERSRKVRMGAAFRADAATVTWVRARLGELGRESEAGPSVPGWIAGLPLELDLPVVLGSFAWDAKERAELAADRAVLAANAELEQRAAELAPAARPSAAEWEQVRVTNAYRAMFGHRALAFDARLQAAVRWHSDYMSRTGVLSHFEDGDPEHYDLAQRTRLAGYAWATGENCSMGRSDARDAHEGWCASSGHHRNLLDPGHRAMASAEAGGYWTQNFGSRTGAAGDLASAAEQPAREEGAQ